MPASTNIRCLLPGLKWDVQLCDMQGVVTLHGGKVVT
jgi:hypothetical protein